MAETAHDSMMMLVEQFKGESENVMVVPVFVESLSFSFEKELNEFYGQEYMVRMLRFIDKQANDGQVSDSYVLSDTLVNNIRKITFDKRMVA